MVHFEHVFKGSIHTTSGSMFIDAFGAAKNDEKPCQITCAGKSMEIVEEVGLSSRKRLDIDYGKVCYTTLLF